MRLLIVLLFMLSLPAFGQGKLYMGIGGGLVGESVQFDKGSHIYSGLDLRNVRSSYQQPIALYYRLTKHYTISAALAYPAIKIHWYSSGKLAYGTSCLLSTFGCTDKLVWSQMTSQSSPSLRLNISRELFVRRKWIFRGLAGFQPTYVIKRFNSFGGKIPANLDQYPYYSKVKQNYERKYHFSVQAGGEVAYQLSPKWEIGLEAFYNQGLHSMFRWDFVYKTGDGNVYRSTHTAYGSYLALSLNVKRRIFAGKEQP